MEFYKESLMELKNEKYIVGDDVNRRHFLRSSAALGITAACPLLLSAKTSVAQNFPGETKKFVREALYYEKLEHKKIRCTLCPRKCVIDDRERGYCGVRENREGTYYTLVYNRACTYHVDPIEKKPLFHFEPSSLAFSIATAGCNVNCKFCQNWQISQVRPEDVRSIHLPGKKVAELAKEYQCGSIAYTYSEPTIFYEYMLDTAIQGRKNGVKSVVITAGYISKEPLVELCKHVDAIKVDLKAFTKEFYRDVVNGELKPVLDSLVTMREQNMWTEIVYLVVPTLNDGEQEIIELCKWITTYLGKDVPIHFTRFHPQYLLKNLPPTPLKTLERCKSIADAAGLHFVYIGNVPGHKAENTWCPKCHRLLIERIGFMIRENHVVNGHCSYCQHPIPGVWAS